MIFALIPVKELSQAKARLAPVLDKAARRELALAMYRDVLAAALACEALDGVVVVSRDEDVVAIAREAGAESLAAPGGPSTLRPCSGQAGSGQALNEALTSAAAKLRERGATRVVVLAADVPLASAADIAAVAQADADVVVAPSNDGGTNALALVPGAIEFAYGPDSARRHLDAAQRGGLQTLRLALPALALDVDTPADLERLRAAAQQAGVHTRAALARAALLPRS